MEWEFIAPMVMSIVLILTIGGVVLLKPVMNRLVELLEVMARSKGDDRLEADVSHIRDLLESMNTRMHLLEDRQDFTDRLLDERRPEIRRITGGDGAASSE